MKSQKQSLLDGLKVAYQLIGDDTQKEINEAIAYSETPAETELELQWRGDRLCEAMYSLNCEANKNNTFSRQFGDRSRYNAHRAAEQVIHGFLTIQTMMRCGESEYQHAWLSKYILYMGTFLRRMEAAWKDEAESFYNGTACIYKETRPFKLAY